MNFFKKIIYIVAIFISSFISVLAVGNEKIKDGLIKGQGSDGLIMNGIDTPDKGDFSALDSLFLFVKDSISSLLVLVVIGVFLFMGIKLATAKGNPEELKKVMTQFIYVAVGIFIVSIAWAAVKLVSGLNI